MASGVPTTSDAYYRCYTALHLVTHRAIPCVDNSLRTWHTNQTIPPCTGQGKCPVGKKLKVPASCQNCTEWGKRIEAAVYLNPPKPGPPPVGPQPPPSQTSQKSPHVVWGNVNTSDLGNSHLEVAKAFVLRLPNKPLQGTGAIGAAVTASKPYSRLEDFDSASLLMIMTRFKDFHGGDQASFEIIEKVGHVDMCSKLDCEMTNAEFHTLNHSCDWCLQCQLCCSEKFVLHVSLKCIIICTMSSVIIFSGSYRAFFFYIDTAS